MSRNSKCVISKEIHLKVLKCYNFQWAQRRHNCSPAASFTNCVMTLYLLKVHQQRFPPIPVIQKCQILSCDTVVANGRYIYIYTLYRVGHRRQTTFDTRWYFAQTESDHTECTNLSTQPPVCCHSTVITSRRWLPALTARFLNDEKKNFQKFRETIFYLWSEIHPE